MTRRSLLRDGGMVSACAAMTAWGARIAAAQYVPPQKSKAKPVTPAATEDFACPMDPDVRSAVPGKCPRCGMQLEARILEPFAYEMTLTATPADVPTGEPVELRFAFRDPRTHQLASRFEQVHEKLFHFFAVSQDLEWFLHDHPVLGGDSMFRLPVTFPSPGMYETFADCYPAGATPQWIPRFLFAQNATPKLAAQTAAPKYVNPQRDGDVEVRLTTEPAEPYAGRSTMLLFDSKPSDGMELWLGSYAHAFWISHDLVDAAHTHPEFFGNLQFEVYFPRPGSYRFWLQFQRKGTLHTVKFDIPVIG